MRGDKNKLQHTTDLSGFWPFLSHLGGGFEPHFSFPI
jgi:hypothetical protein